MDAHARTIPYHDRVAHQRRRTRMVRRGILTLLVCALLGGVAWWVLFSSLLDVRTVAVSGVPDAIAAMVQARVTEELNARSWGVLPRNRSMLVANLPGIRTAILSAFPDLETVKISRAFPHELRIIAGERAIAGVWCFREDCRFFDAHGATWPGALPSEGALLLTVHDERAEKPEAIAQDVLVDVFRIRDALVDMNVRARSLTLHDGAAHDIAVRTMDGYDVLFTRSAALADQLQTLLIYLADQRRQDVPISAKTVDVRIAGRIYLK